MNARKKKKKDKNGAKYKIMKLKFEVELLAKTQLINSLLLVNLIL